jgi:PQQ-dependent dehydrogenase (methanol/ethanol family)
LPQIADRQSGLRLCALLALACLPAHAVRADDDGQWTRPGKDFAATRFSELDQITSSNVGKLRSVWNFSTGVLSGHEGQPLVVKDTMYVVTPYPNVLYAFDLTKEDYPLRFKYRPDVNPAAVGIACCDSVNRGAVYAEGKIVYNLLDGRTVAVDAKTGEEVWKVTVADLSRGETITMAPLVVGDRVFVGPSGGEYGIRGWFKALDLATGKLVWEARNLGPDSAVLAKPGIFKPFYDTAPSSLRRAGPRDLEAGRCPVWGWLSTIPSSISSTTAPATRGPYNPEQREGDNKWTSSVLARRPGDGSLVWAYQFTPHDNWDYDSNAENILAEIVTRGRARQGPRAFRQERLCLRARSRHG